MQSGTKPPTARALRPAPDRHERPDHDHVGQEQCPERDQPPLPGGHEPVRIDATSTATTRAASTNPPAACQALAGTEARTRSDPTRAPPTPNGMTHVSPKTSLRSERRNAVTPAPQRGSSPYSAT